MSTTKWLILLVPCLLGLVMAGCADKAPPASPAPAEEDASPETDDDTPAPDEPTTPSDASQTESEGSGGFELDVDVGPGGVHVETGGPDGQSGVDVDIDPSEGVRVDVGEDDAEASQDPAG